MPPDMTRWGYPFNRSKLWGWITLGLARTLRGPLASFRRGSGPMRIASTTWSGSDGPPASPAQAAGTRGGWRLGDGRFMCSGCGGRTSVTGGTIFDRTRPPLTVWFTACWLFATGKDGISALSLQRTLEVGSYQTAWAMLQRLRSVLVRPGRDRLAGTVAVDETYIGGEESGLRGGRAPGEEGADRHCGGGPGPEWARPVPDAAAGRCVGRLAAPICDRSRRARRASHHRRLAGLPRAGEARLRPRPAQPAGRPGSRGGPWRGSSPRCTESPRWSSGGCWAPTKARWATRTWPGT